MNPIPVMDKSGPSWRKLGLVISRVAIAITQKIAKKQNVFSKRVIVVFFYLLMS